jgi:hypothetical protein
MKHLYKIALFFVVILGITSCQPKVNYPIIPAITFQSLVVHPDSSATLKILFTDGDGDIGYPSGETSAPPDFCFEILQQNANGTYYTVTEPGVISDPVTGDTVVFPYHIPYITPTGNNKELSGQIQIALRKGDWSAANNVTEELCVWIVDRAGHKSNRIITTPVLVP